MNCSDFANRSPRHADILNLSLSLALLTLAISGCSSGTSDAVTKSEAAGWGTAAPLTALTVTSGVALLSEVRVDATGHAIAVWQQERIVGATTTDIEFEFTLWANRFVPETGWGPAGLLDTDERTGTLYYPVSPQVAVAPDGDAVAVWHNLDGTRDDVWASRFVPDTGWGPATLLETDNAGSARDTDVAVDARGHAVAVWSQSDGTRSHVWANHYMPGTGWDTAIRLDTNDSVDQYSPLIAMNPAGDAIVVWPQFDGTRWELWANRFVAGNGWGAATGLGTADPGQQMRDSALSINDHGDAMVVWPQSNGTGWNLWARRFVPGIGWNTAISINSNESGDVWYPRVATDLGGNAIVVWAQPNNSPWNSWVTRFVPSTGWTTPTRLNPDATQNTWFPDVVMNSSGDAIMAWAESNATSSSIWARRFDRLTGWKPAVPIDPNESGDARNPQIALDITGNAIVVWERFNGSTTNLWANHFVP
jgi:hypothetical protein